MSNYRQLDHELHERIAESPHPTDKALTVMEFGAADSIAAAYLLLVETGELDGEEVPDRYADHIRKLPFADASKPTRG
jgi:hypothetical protein